MDSFLDLTSLLLGNGGSKEPSSYDSLYLPSSESADIPVDAERAGTGLSSTYCVIS